MPKMTPEQYVTSPEYQEGLLAAVRKGFEKDDLVPPDTLEPGEDPPPVKVEGPRRDVSAFGERPAPMPEPEPEPD